MRLCFTHLAIDFIELQSIYVYTHTHTRTSARNPYTPTHTYTYVLYVWYKQWTRKHRVKKIEIIRYIIAFEDSLWIYLPIYFLFLFFLFLFFFSVFFYPFFFTFSLPYLLLVRQRNGYGIIHMQVAVLIALIKRETTGWRSLSSRHESIEETTRTHTHTHTHA